MSETVPVEKVEPGDEVLVGRRVGWRPVIRVDTFDGHRGDPDATSYVVIYAPAGPGAALENKARAHGVSFYHREEASLACKGEGDLLTIRKRGKA